LIRYFGHHSHYDLVKTSIFGQILKNFQVWTKFEFEQIFNGIDFGFE
jgi:hypothetical protein